MRRVVLIQPKRDGRVFGKAPGSPYTMMRLASLVPDEMPDFVCHHEAPLPRAVRRLRDRDDAELVLPDEAALLVL